MGIILVFFAFHFRCCRMCTQASPPSLPPSLPPSSENLGPSILPLRNFDYIRGFIKFMVAELGYGPGLDLFAAPYDWRYTPDVLKEQVRREGGREGGREEK